MLKNSVFGFFLAKMANKGGGGEGAFMAVSLGLSANETVHPIKGRGTPLADGFCDWGFRNLPFLSLFD